MVRRGFDPSTGEVVAAILVLLLFGAHVVGVVISVLPLRRAAPSAREVVRVRPPDRGPRPAYSLRWWWPNRRSASFPQLSSPHLWADHPRVGRAFPQTALAGDARPRTVTLRDGEIGGWGDSAGDASLSDEGATLCLATTRRESWADVVSALARVRLALDGKGSGQRRDWDLSVCLGWFQGPAVWHASFGTLADEDAAADVPFLRFSGEATDLGPGVVLEIGEEALPFPPEAESVSEAMAWRMGARAVEEWREASRTVRLARLPVDPFLEWDFVIAMDDVWERVAPALRDAAEGTRVVRIRIEEAGGIVRWGYVVAVLDHLLANGVDTFVFDPPGWTLCCEVPPEPAPRRPWLRPVLPSPSSPGPALALGGLLAVFAFRGPRRRPSRSNPADEG